MVDHLFENILSGYSYIGLFGIACVYFLLLYFVLAPAFLLGCKILHEKRLLKKIVDKKVPKSQINFEIRHAVTSVLIFGASAIPLVFLVRTGVIVLLPDTISNVIAGILIYIGKDQKE